MASNIVERIRKLFELSKNNPSPEEAASAAARAAELMFKYQIGEADLDTGERKSESEPLGEVAIAGGGGQAKGQRAVWKSKLANAVAQGFGCEMYFERDTFKVYGLKSIVQTVSYVYQYLALEVGRLCNESWETFAGGMPTDYRTKLAVKWKNSFRIGAVTAIEQRLIAEKAKQVVRVEQAPQSSALVLYKTDQERVAEGWDKRAKELNLRHVRSTFRPEASAYERGEAAGRKIPLEGSGRNLEGAKKRIGGGR